MTTLSMDQCCKLIMEAYIQVGGISLVKALLEGPSESPGANNNLSWCVCGRCRNMATPDENVCCRNPRCLTTTDMFETIVLNRDVLSVAIVHRADVYSGPCVFSVKLHIGSGHCVDVDTSGEKIARLYQLVLFGLYEINTQPRIVFT